MENTQGRQKSLNKKAEVSVDITLLCTCVAVGAVLISKIIQNLELLHTVTPLPVLETAKSQIMILTIALATTAIAAVITATTLTARKITGLKRQEIQLREEKDQALSAAQVKSEFLAVMSHEIRTPMNCVIGMVDLIGKTELNGSQKNMLRAVRESSFILLHTINDVLDFSKIEAGKMTLEKIPISVNHLVEGVAEAMDTSARDKGMVLDIELDPRIPTRVIGDPGKLRQILFNLVSNAQKFTATDADNIGKVTVHTVLIEHRDARAAIELHVVDNGIGIAAEKLDKLFTPFNQACASTARHYGGTGLGLSICKQLVELMEGSIQVESKVGTGSTFSVRIALPVADEPERTDLDQTDLYGVRILLLGTSTTEMQILQRYLSHCHARVDEAHSPGAAFAKISSVNSDYPPPDVIITTTEKLYESVYALTGRAHKETGGLRFIVLSQHSFQPAKFQTENTNVIFLRRHPLRRTTLIESVAVAAGLLTPEASSVRSDTSTAALPSLDEAEASGRLVLVAEDFPVNQTVIQQQLQTLGYRCNIAADGFQALEMMQQRNYALVLADCHMPRLDGYQLTKTLRERESTDTRIPIIAITADALQGTAEYCRNMGMDDYLSKPLELQKLRALLDKWLPASKLETQPLADNAENPLDLSRLQSLLGTKNGKTISSILENFVDICDVTVEAIHLAASQNDLEELARLAHKMKSSAAQIGAGRLATSCGELETAGGAGISQQVTRLLPNFTHQYKVVCETINRHTANHHTTIRFPPPNSIAVASRPAQWSEKG